MVPFTGSASAMAVSYTHLIEEVKHAKEEGVEFLTLHNPIEYIADEQGKVFDWVVAVSYTHL